MYAKMYSTGRYDYLFDADFTYSPSARTNPDGMYTTFLRYSLFWLQYYSRDEKALSSQSSFKGCNESSKIMSTSMQSHRPPARRSF